MEAEKSKTRHSLTGFLVRTLFLLFTWLPPCYILTQQREMSFLSYLFFTRALISFLSIPPLLPNYLLKAPPPNATTPGIRVSRMNFEGTQTFSPQLLCVGNWCGWDMRTETTFFQYGRYSSP